MAWVVGEQLLQAFDLGTKVPSEAAQLGLDDVTELWSMSLPFVKCICFVLFFAIESELGGALPVLGTSVNPSEQGFASIH